MVKIEKGIPNLTDAILSLARSMEAASSLNRSHYCHRAAAQLRKAGLPSYAEHCAALAEVYHGDGCGVRRLYDELCDLEARVREFGDDSGFSLVQIVAGLTTPVWRD